MYIFGGCLDSTEVSYNNAHTEFGKLVKQPNNVPGNKYSKVKSPFGAFAPAFA